jgi:hypothetical protein
MFGVNCCRFQIIKKLAEFQHSPTKNELNNELWFDFSLKSREHGYEL